MGYRIERNETINDGVRRIATEQIEKAIGELGDNRLDPPTQVHQVRKRCKKLRGLLRLLRPGFEATYDKRNRWCRDTARLLSGARDAKVLLDTYDDLMEHYNDPVDRHAFGSIRRRLT
ncbi:CHAD domain protein [Rosistilla ulvae]|uniref:CHAD domain protein n=1 Tax=Rosistilla ulvae TaxID=1930277 RepID=A0A517M569_9BACT|nr:CHAD domain-containing protein [Rosistilla ulvae]QDS90013.1 CHAD domain protein [Rosistilla ulvae]